MTRMRTAIILWKINTNQGVSVVDQIWSETLANDRLLSSLPRRDQQIVLLLSEGLSIAEIAFAIGISSKTADVFCSRLRDHLTQWNEREVTAKS